MKILINNEDHNDLCVGIDLGTTNSVLASVNYVSDKKFVARVLDIPRAVQAVTGDRYKMQNFSTLPSAVYYNDNSFFPVLVGDFAKEKNRLRPYIAQFVR